MSPAAIASLRAPPALSKRLTQNLPKTKPAKRVLEFMAYVALL